MTLKLKTPPMPEPDGQWHWTNIKTGKSGLYEEDPRQFGIDLDHPEYKWVRLPSAAQLAARDAKWLELLGPVVGALSEAVDLAWIEDSHLVQFDSTVIFSPHYDYSGLTGSSRIEFLGKHECIVWRSGGKWSAYCTYEGSTWFERFDSAEDAKEQCMRLLDKVLPDHPAMRARAALRAITEEQE